MISVSGNPELRTVHPGKVFQVPARRHGQDLSFEPHRRRDDEPAARKLGNPKLIEPLIRPCACLLRGNVPYAHRHRDVSLDRCVKQQRILKNECNPSAQCEKVTVACNFTKESDSSGGRSFKQSQNKEKARFSSPVRPNHRDDFALLHSQLADVEDLSSISNQSQVHFAESMGFKASSLSAGYSSGPQ